MSSVKIVVTRYQNHNQPTLVQELTATLESDKRLTASRAARLLARSLPGFRRVKGRAARFAGAEVLPVLEAAELGWCAWRLHTGDATPSGYEPPLPGRTGKSNATDNPRADRTKGVWERASICELLPAAVSNT